MKIKIITCQRVYNYGASLQALALQHYLEKEGCDVQIIDYTPDYQKFSVWNVPKSSHLYKPAKYSRIIRCIYALKVYLRVRPTLSRIKAFDKFSTEYHRLTCQYNSYEELAADPPMADLYIAGSDQIWSTHLQNGRDPAFYCAFGKVATKRISYAASFGFPEILGGYDSFVKSMLRGLDAISVREKTGINILENLGLKGVHVVDPVLLLEKEEWVKLLKVNTPIIEGKYILVYDLSHKDKRLNTFSKQLSKKYNLKIVAVNNKAKTEYADININNAGPAEFVNLLAHSEFVISDSFHATAFSVIFQKQFYVYYNQGNISRISDFLKIIGLEPRLNATSELPDINWGEHYSALNDMVGKSKDYLRLHL